MITQSFDLNLIPEQAPVVVHCDQYDKGTGRLIIKLYEGDVAYSPSGTAIIQGIKPDNKGFTYSATLVGNTVTADLTEQMSAVSGHVRCQVVVTESTGRTGTFAFILDVQASALPLDTDLSDSDYQFIEEAIEDAQQAIEDAQDAVEDSEAWAVGERGGVPVDPTDETYHNNSKYWSDQASQYAQGGLHFQGSIPFANIPTTGQVNGDMYNITDSFTTDNRFIEGAGIVCSAGTNIAWVTSQSKWDLLAAGGGGGGGMNTDGSNAGPTVDMLGTDKFVLGVRTGKPNMGAHGIELGNGAVASGDGAYAEGYLAPSFLHLKSLQANTPTETLTTSYSISSYPVQYYSLLGPMSDPNNIQVSVLYTLSQDEIITDGDVTIRVTEESGNINVYYTNTGNTTETLYFATEPFNVAQGNRSHAEGSGTRTDGIAAHSEGKLTVASGNHSHVEGYGASASGLGAHAEGYSTTASGAYSHAEGYSTKASSNYQHVSGKYNVEDTTNTYAVIVGNGTAENDRSNALTLDWAGNLEVSGDVKNGNGLSLDGMNITTPFLVPITGWTSDTTSQSGTTLYKKTISLTKAHVNKPTINIGSTGALPTKAEQEAYNLLQYVIVDDAVPCLYLFASAVPTTSFYINVTGVE